MLRKSPPSALQGKAPRSGQTDFSVLQILALAVALTLLISIPIWTHPLPPLSDYVNHLARMHVIADLYRNQQLAMFYQLNWQVIPNLAMDAIVPPLARLVNVYLAGQIFLVATFALIMSGVVMLNRALVGRFSVLPLLAIPLLYNYIFLVGLTNYQFGVGFALWALAAWVSTRERVWPIRFALSTASVVILFFCHLSSLGIYAIGLLSVEILRLWQQSPRPGRRELRSSY